MSKTVLEYVMSAQADLTELSERISPLLGKESQELLDTAGDALSKAETGLKEAYALIGLAFDDGSPLDNGQDIVQGHGPDEPRASRR